jgi:hypothetical protein
MWSASTEVIVAFGPEVAYRRLLGGAIAPAGRQLLQRLGVILLVIGIAIPVMAVQRATILLVVTAALSWSFVLAIQVTVAAFVIASVPARPIGTLAALNLWFVAHLPYTVWMLAASVMMATSRYASAELLIGSAIIPAAWTFVIISAFCRVVLQTGRAGAWWHAIAHQLVIWTIALSYVAWAAGGWFQVLGPIDRMFS